MTSETRNMITAVVLSLIVLAGWQYFVVGPQLERAARQAEIEAQQNAEQQGRASGVDVATPVAGSANATPDVASTEFADRAAAIAGTPRVSIDTPALAGSINLVGGRIDDLALKNYRETVDPDSPIIHLLEPAGAPRSYFAEQGWVTAAGGTAKVPTGQTVWQVAGNDTLTQETPVTLTWDNGEGLEFRRTIAVDENYLFTITQEVTNTSTGDVALFPYAQISRHETPKVAGFFILQEGPLGVLGDANLVEKSYAGMKEELQSDYESNGGWLGFTDKYWATAIMPAPETPINSRFSYTKPAQTDIYKTSYVNREPVVVGAGSSAKNTSYLFAGAKVESIINTYETTYKFDRLELLIDWGWFHFITKPMFYMLRFIEGITGNFGVAILIVTVMVKALFFPLANKSYASMAAMRKVQPQIKALQEKYGDDRAAMQKAQMELFQKEKINPIAGCWPMLLQIPVFFSLYKVLFVTIEMRHAPFFGWIRDLASPDPTNIFNLFGLIPYDPTVLPVVGGFLHLGVWPVLMGIAMWAQMKLNPPPTDPTQAMIFGLMPIIFTFMLGGFPAGLVIYWTWNNFLGIVQQYAIMRRHGVEVNLLANMFGKSGKKADPPAR
ncbi:MAG TPA: membrane protein insertase YidC [Devosia sp.]|nr:membrane protein insertase YidC [Devosia sp.]